MRFALVSICFVFLLLASSAYAFEPVLDVSLTNQIPYPVQPGHNFTAEIEIQNSGFGDAENYIVEIVEASPFKILPGQELTKTFGRIAAKDSAKTSWRLIVDSQTLSGDYDMNFKLYKEGQSGWLLYKVPISVQGNPELVIKSADITGASEPGGQIALLINISNIGTGSVRQLKLSFLSSPELTPILTGGSIYLGELKAGQSTQAIVNLSVSSDAEYKTYTANLTAGYVDESGQSKTDQFSIGIPVEGSILLDIININPDFERQKLDIDVANKGTAEARAMTASLVINGQTVGIDYTSSVKADKKVTFSFPLVTTGSGYINLTYTGPGLQAGQTTKDVVLNFSRSAGSEWTVVIVIVVVVVIGYWWFKIRKKKK